MQHDLSNRVAIVTGASRGLGAAIALKLGQGGAKVAVNYHGSPEKAKRIAKQIADLAAKAFAVKADVGDEADVNASSPTPSKLGPNRHPRRQRHRAAAVRQARRLTWRACLDQLEFFVKSPVLFAKAVVGPMKERRYGRIINIGSEVFEKGVPEFSNYVAAKGAQLGLTRSWAMELAKFGITVNLVAPGWIPTERHVERLPGSRRTPTPPPSR